jgi:P pilus assembly chaperone PapD
VINWLRRVAFGLWLAGWAPARLAAQSVMIAPTAVIMDEHTRSAALTLISQDTGRVEVTIMTIYGYPMSDSAGRVFVRTFETPDDTMPAASRWVSSYPGRLVLEPGARRTVRLVATPPASLPAGEYWGRVVVAARGGRVPVSGAPADRAISTALNLEIRSVLGLFYRKGVLTTGATITEVRAATTGDSLAVRATLTRHGKAAFLGTLRAELCDSTGAVRAEAALPLGVYYTLTPRLTLPITGLPRGQYRLVVDLTTTRPELPPSALVQARPVRGETTVRLP